MERQALDDKPKARSKWQRQSPRGAISHVSGRTFAGLRMQMEHKSIDM